MRKLIYSINLTIDGCCDHTKFSGDDEMLSLFSRHLRQGGLLAYGRVTYDMMVPFWPDMARARSGQTAAANEFARVFDSMDKVVFSRTLESVADHRSRLVRGSPADEIRRLKREEGKSILLGGVSLPTELMELGLIDEYFFVIHPVIAGEGRRLFPDAKRKEKLQLKLAESETLPSGCVTLRYVAGGHPV